MDTKQMHIGLLAIGIALSVMVAGCTTGATEATGTKAAADERIEKRVCLNSNAIRGYDAITDKYVYVREGRNKHYLLTMQTRCTNLSDAFTIVVSDTTSRVCSRGFGKIIYDDRFSGRSVESCRIRTVERVDSKEHAEQIVAALTGAPPDEGTWSDLPDEDQDKDQNQEKDKEKDKDGDENKK